MKWAFFFAALGFLFNSCSGDRIKNEEKLSEYKVYLHDTIISFIHSKDRDALFELLLSKKSVNGEIQDGIWTIYYDEAMKTKAVEFTVKENKLNGKYAYWVNDGNKWLEGTTANGLSNGTFRTWSDGTLVEEWEERNDTVTGTRTLWNKDGSVIKTEYRAGKKVKFIEYNSKGQLVKEVFFMERPYYGNPSNFEYIEVRYQKNGTVEGAYLYDRFIVHESLEEYLTLEKIKTTHSQTGFK